MGMRKKLGSLFRRNPKTSNIKPTANLAISRLAVLKNHRQARCSIAQSDVVNLLNIGHHERALLRVEQVIKEQNMLDVFVMIEGYCVLLVERVNLVEQEKICPDELKEAISSLIYAASRCGELPELQEIRAIFTSQFGRDFATRAIELRNNCGVHPQMVQKMSTKMPSLEIRLKVLKEIASANNIVLQIEEVSSVATELLEKSGEKQNQDQPKSDPQANLSTGKLKNNLSVSPEEIVRVDNFSDSVVGKKKKYRDVAEAAQAAFESAAYAAAAARAAVELSRSESQDPDDPPSPDMKQRKVDECQIGKEDDEYLRRNENLNTELGFEKINPIQNYLSESEDEEIHIENEVEFKRSVSWSSSDSGDNILEETKLSSDLDFGIKLTSEIGFYNPKTSDVKGEVLSEVNDSKLHYKSQKPFPLRSQAGLEEESGPGNPKSHVPAGSRINGPRRLNEDNTPISMRTRRTYGL